MLPKMEKAYKLAMIKGLPRIAARILDVKIDKKTKTAKTNGADIFFSPSFLDKLSVEDTLFIMAHEYYHIIYDHPRRAKENNFKPDTYNVACDVIINEHLVDVLELKRPEGEVAGMYRDNPMFRDMPDTCDTSTKIYHWMIENGKEGKSMGDIGEPSNENEARNKAERLLEQQEHNSKELIEAIDVEVPKVKTNWIDLITAMQIESGRLVRREIKHNYSRPSRREFSKTIVLPASRHVTAKPKIDVYIDVSGSMGEHPVTIFNGLRAILAHLSLYQPTFYTFDTNIRKVDVKEDLRLGGGTDIHRVLDKIEKDKADLAILITDCEDSIEREDIARNVIVVSDDMRMADYYTENWEVVRKI